jgi:hypothetical protein
VKISCVAKQEIAINDWMPAFEKFTVVAGEAVNGPMSKQASTVPFFIWTN